jgi:hypothetical protein
MQNAECGVTTSHSAFISAQADGVARMKLRFSLSGVLSTLLLIGAILGAVRQFWLVPHQQRSDALRALNAGQVGVSETYNWRGLPEPVKFPARPTRLPATAKLPTPIVEVHSVSIDSRSTASWLERMLSNSFNHLHSRSWAGHGQ